MSVHLLLLVMHIDLIATGNSNTVTINENSTATMQSNDKKVTAVTLIGSSNTVTTTHAGAGDHDTTLHHTGSTGTFAITQDGIHDTNVTMTTVGAGHNVTVTVDD